MSAKNYANFDLLIEKIGDKYRARVLSSPAGEATLLFDAPFSSLELENFRLRLGQSQRRVRRIDSPEMENAKLFGQRLFQTVFTDDIGACLQSSMAQAALQNAGLRLRLRLSDARELMDVPWEYLYDANVNRFLALSIDTPLVRYLDQPGYITPLLVTPPLKVLAVISSPTDYLQLDVEQEWRMLKEAVADLESLGLLKLDRLDVATLERLQRQLRRHEYHVFHFIGHGGFNEAADDGILLMEDDQGRGREVSGQTLGMLMHDEKSLRLALLNACEGGRTSVTDPFSGVGQSLLQQGIPAVIAMQREVTDDTAITMAHAFYMALADGYPVDAALTEARKSIFVKNDLEWGTPVLYMRTLDGQIFDVDQVALAAVRKEHEPKAEAAVAPAPLTHLTEEPPAAEVVSAAPTLTAQPPPAQPARRWGGGWMRLLLLVLAMFGAGSAYSVWRGTSGSSVRIGSNVDVATNSEGSSTEESSPGAITAAPAAAVAPPTNTPTGPSPTATATDGGAATPVQSASCVGISNPALHVGSWASICTSSGYSIGMRLGPGDEYTEVGRLHNGTEFVVIGGPTCGGYRDQEFNWWQIRANGQTAWIVDGKDAADPVFLCAREADALQPVFEKAVFCTRVDSQEQCLNPVTNLSSGIAKFWINWPFQNLPLNTKVDRIWYHNGARIDALARSGVIWDENRTHTEGIGATYVQENAGLADGEYRVELYLTGQSHPIGVATVQIGDFQESVANFAGTWGTNFAQITLRQSGTSVTGSYLRYGQTAPIAIEGTVGGQTLSGHYLNDPTTEFAFTLRSDGHSFDGYWLQRATNQRRQWCGARNLSLPDGCGFSGHWLAKVGGDSGWVTLQQTGNQISGTFFDSQNSGTLTGRLGQSGHGDSPHYSAYGSYQLAGSQGTFRFDLVDFDAEQFQGCWLSGPSGGRGEWCGWREGQSAPARCEPASCP